MNEPIFDHEKLDVYRLSIDYVAYSYAVATRLTATIAMPAINGCKQFALNIAEGNGKHSLKDRSRFFDIARGSALECAAIHDILSVCGAIEEEENRTGRALLRRIVAMLTKLVARHESVSETPSIYRAIFEHEHEHEHEEKPEPSDATETSRSCRAY